MHKENGHRMVYPDRTDANAGISGEMDLAQIYVSPGFRVPSREIVGVVRGALAGPAGPAATVAR